MARASPPKTRVEEASYEIGGKDVKRHDGVPIKPHGCCGWVTTP